MRIKSWAIIATAAWVVAFATGLQRVATPGPHPSITLEKTANAATPTSVKPEVQTLLTVEKENQNSLLTSFRQNPAGFLKTSLMGPPPPQRVTLAVDKGDTLMGLLNHASVPMPEAASAIEALRQVYDPRNIKTGQKIDVLFQSGTPDTQFVGLEMAPTLASFVTVSRTGTSFKATEIEKPIQHRLVAAQGTIQNSLFEAGQEAGIPPAILAEMLKIYAYDVDFQRDIHPGDSFRVVFERDYAEDGTPVREGAIVHASMKLGGKELPRYRFTMKDGTTDMFDRNGNSARRALLRTPVDGARITSRFGMRHHPILGFTKMHKGVDFAAPRGTHIYAAGNGTIDEIGFKGSYGNYIRVRHNSYISTAYAHMARFATGLHRGSRVNQGEVIGYVGTTGRSTGPHLHYEVLKGGSQVNPLTVDVRNGPNLDKKSLKPFQGYVQNVDTVFENVKAGQLQFASLTMPTDASSVIETPTKQDTPKTPGRP